MYPLMYVQGARQWPDRPQVTQVRDTLSQMMHHPLIDVPSHVCTRGASVTGSTPSHSGSWHTLTDDASSSHRCTLSCMYKGRVSDRIDPKSLRFVTSDTFFHWCTFPLIQSVIDSKSLRFWHRYTLSFDVPSRWYTLSIPLNCSSSLTFQFLSR